MSFWARPATMPPVKPSIKWRVFWGCLIPAGRRWKKLALGGNPLAIDFPRAKLGNNFEFSFSGLKSAVINYLHNKQQAGEEVNRADVAASFQYAIVDALVQKSVHALKETGLKEIVLAGGVSANKTLQNTLAKAAERAGARLVHQLRYSARIMQ